MPEPSSQFLKASIARIISDSYRPSIGNAYCDMRQASRMSKRRTVWARVEEVLVETGKPSTQKYGAALVGLKQPSAALWNKPGNYPAMEVAVQLAEKLGICVQWLLNEEGPKRAPPNNDKHLDALYLFWPRLSETDKRDLVGFARVRIEMPKEAQSDQAFADKKANISQSLRDSR